MAGTVRPWCVLLLAIVVAAAGWACTSRSSSGGGSASTGGATVSDTLHRDTLIVRGRVDVIGNEPFTRQRLTVGPDSGFVLSFRRDTSIALRASSATAAEVRGRPYRTSWQGQTLWHLEVYSWRLVR